MRGPLGSLALELKGRLQSADIDVYSRAFQKVARLHDQGLLGPGWVRLPLDLGGLASGAYFLRIQALGEAGEKASFGPVKLVLLR